MRMGVRPQPLHQGLCGVNQCFPLFFIDNHFLVGKAVENLNIACASLAYAPVYLR